MLFASHENPHGLFDHLGFEMYETVRRHLRLGITHEEIHASNEPTILASSRRSCRFRLKKLEKLLQCLMDKASGSGAVADVDPRASSLLE